MLENPDKESKLQLKEAQVKTGMETPPVPERRRRTREEILERKISMAKERGSRVLKINCPLGSIMFNVLRHASV